MKQTMSERIADLERDLRVSEGKLKAALEENADLKSGAEFQRVSDERSRLVRFARECERWGAAPCQCQYAATIALRDVGEEK